MSVKKERSGRRSVEAEVEVPGTSAEVWAAIATGTGHAELLMLLDEPVGGVAHLFAMPMGEQVLLPVRLYLYGDDAEDVASRDQPVWERWMRARLGSAEAS